MDHSILPTFCPHALFFLLSSLQLLLLHTPHLSQAHNVPSKSRMTFLLLWSFSPCVRLGFPTADSDRAHAAILGSALRRHKKVRKYKIVLGKRRSRSTLCLQVGSQQVPQATMDLGAPSSLSQIVLGTEALHSLISQSSVWVSRGRGQGGSAILGKACPCNQSPFHSQVA